MANWFKIAVDEIAAKIPGVTRILVGNIGRYRNVYGNLDFTNDNDIPNVAFVKARTPGSPELIMIPKDTEIPFTIDMTTGDRPQFGLVPTVLCHILKAADGVVVDDTIKVLQPNMAQDLKYDDNTLTTLSEIQIGGNPDDTGLLFNEDTYVTLKA